MNSFLQSWFQLPGFRRIIYQIPASHQHADIASSLQMLFTYMQRSPESVKANIFTRSLGLGSFEIDASTTFKGSQGCSSAAWTRSSATPRKAAQSAAFSGARREFV
jgi:hypothetical protein